jgi:hypothetical protein
MSSFFTKLIATPCAQPRRNAGWAIAYAGNILRPTAAMQPQENSCFQSMQHFTNGPIQAQAHQKTRRAKLRWQPTRGYLAAEASRAADAVDVQLTVVGQVVVDHERHLRPGTPAVVHSHFCTAAAQYDKSQADPPCPHLLSPKGVGATPQPPISITCVHALAPSVPAGPPTSLGSFPLPFHFPSAPQSSSYLTS